MDEGCLQHNTSIKAIKHSAIASWGGFVYQAMCALCVMMEDLLKDDDKIVHRKLNIEGYDDFAILDTENMILSFHQAKCYKNNKNFGDEFHKMSMKRVYWHKKEKCENDTPLYFHTNLKEISCTQGVEIYKYRDDSTSLSPVEASDKFQKYVTEYLKNNTLPGNSDVIRIKMINLIQQLVIELDEMGKKGDIDMQQASIDKSIPYLQFIDILKSNDNDISEQDLIRSTVFYIKLWITQRIIEDPSDNDEYSCELFDKLEVLSNNEKKEFIKRIFPDKDICNGLNIFAELTNSNRANNLDYVLCTAKGIDWETLSWNRNGDLCTPSTLGTDLTTKHHAKHILQNKNRPVDLLRDYRWIVGNVRTTTEDIYKVVNDITDVDGLNYADITENRKVGIIKAEDMNNEQIH